MTPHISSTEAGSYRVIGLGLLLAVGACDDEFPNEPPITISADPASLQSSTMMVRDTDTIEVQLSGPHGLVAGMEIRWTSSNPALLELKPIPPQSTSRSDSLRAQMRVQAIAHAHGSVVVTANTDQPGVSASVVEDTVTILERWAAVTAGGGYTCGLTVDQDAYCWGGIPTGLIPASLGLGNGFSLAGGRPAPVLGGHKFIALVAGDDQTCGITAASGLLYCWGRNVWGELGNGSLDNSLIPTLVVGGRSVSQVNTRTGLTCGVMSSVALVDEASRNSLCWGRASLGELGDVNAVRSPDAAVVCSDFGRYVFECIAKPLLTVGFDGGGDFLLQSVSVGGDFACGIAKTIGRLVEGSVWCWGLNDLGQLGQGSPTGECSVLGDNEQFPPTPVSCSIEPVELSGELSFVTLSSGRRHSCGVISTMTVYCWGNTYGPTPVALAGADQFDSISVGGSLTSDVSHACALTSQGQAYCWGDNVDGELGSSELPVDGTRIHHADMQRVSQDTLVFVAISTSKSSFNRHEDAAHTCGLTRDGAIYCWGDNSQGALGTPALTRIAVPTRIAEPLP